MDYKRLLVFFCLLIILSATSGCSKKTEIQLKLGQTLVEVIDNEFFYFEEYVRVDSHSFKGMTLDKYIAQYYHDSFNAFIKSNWAVDVEDNHNIENEEYDVIKDATVIEVYRYGIKDASTYVTVPGEIELLFASDDPIDYELVNDSTVKINDWNSETSISIAFIEGEYEQIKDPKDKDNYVLFDYSTIDKLTYKEIIAVKLEDYRNGKIITPLSEWIGSKGLESYESLLETISFKWAVNKDKVSVQELKKHDDELVLSFGQISSDTYIRVPKEILFITDDVKYQYIDEKTILVNEGNVTIIYKD